jgi:hypothetical protein
MAEPSAVTVKSELTLFDQQAVQTSITRQNFVSIQPVGSIVQNAPIEFVIAPSTFEYIDFASTTLNVTFHLETEKPYLLAKHMVGCANMPIASLFQDVQLFIGDTLVEGSTNMYAYKAMICTLLDYGSAAQKSLLQPWGFYKDTAGAMDDKVNKGLESRANQLAGKKKWSVSGPLFLDLARQQQRYLLNHLPIRIKLQPSSGKWFGMAYEVATGGDSVLPTDIAVKLDKVELTVRYVMPAPSVLDAHRSGLQSWNAIYPLQAIELSTFLMPSNTQSIIKNQLFADQIPKLLLLAIVTNEAFNGSLKTNPFNFANPKLNFLNVCVDGISVPSRPRQLTAGELTSGDYVWLLQQLGLYQQNRDIGINMDEYGKGGFALFAFSLGSELGAGTTTGAAQLYKQGNLSIELRLAEATTKTLNVILAGIFDRRLEITSERAVIPVNLYK